MSQEKTYIAKTKPVNAQGFINMEEKLIITKEETLKITDVVLSEGRYENIQLIDGKIFGVLDISGNELCIVEESEGILFSGAINTDPENKTKEGFNTITFSALAPIKF